MKPAALLQRAAACLTMAAVMTAQAQPYPSKPIRLIVPFSPGGLPDTVARVLSPRLQAGLGQPLVVENKPSASGAVAAAALAQSPADGHTLLLTDGTTLAIAPWLAHRAAGEATPEFAPVSLVGTAPLFLAANARVQVHSLDELLAQAKAHPGAFNYGSSGVGSVHHLTAEAMKAGLGIALTHIPFRGSGNSVPAMVAGDVDLVFASPPSLMGFVKSGQARLLAINSARRSPLAPEVPALSEKIPGFDFAFTLALLAKAGTPREAIEKISAEIAKIVRQPEVAEQLHKAGVEPLGEGPQQLAQALAAESARVTAAAKLAQLKAE